MKWDKHVTDKFQIQISLLSHFFKSQFILSSSYFWLKAQSIFFSLLLIWSVCPSNLNCSVCVCVFIDVFLAYKLVVDLANKFKIIENTRSYYIMNKFISSILFDMYMLCQFNNILVTMWQYYLRLVILKSRSLGRRILITDKTSLQVLLWR